KLHLVDELLDDRRRIDRTLAHRPQRHSTAAGLVAREGGLVDQENRGSPLGEPVRGRRPGGPATDDDRVVVLHREEATMRRTSGGVPEWPKGTGCNPVGSAYGGSNPPAPINAGEHLRFSPADPLSLMHGRRCRWFAAPEPSGRLSSACAGQAGTCAGSSCN